MLNYELLSSTVFTSNRDLDQNDGHFTVLVFFIHFKVFV